MLWKTYLYFLCPTIFFSNVSNIWRDENHDNLRSFQQCEIVTDKFPKRESNSISILFKNIPLVPKLKIQLFIQAIIQGTCTKSTRPGRDSNPQPPDPKSGALSIAPPGHVTLAGVYGIYPSATTEDLKNNIFMIALFSTLSNIICWIWVVLLENWYAYSVEADAKDLLTHLR